MGKRTEPQRRAGKREFSPLLSPKARVELPVAEKVHSHAVSPGKAMSLWGPPGTAHRNVRKEIHTQAHTHTQV